ncbi:carboxynorspermidine decarboxylase (plasmid) [Rhizobium etli 8C-3]|uniref:Carboxynorspermidine/carboxyspermidine decarboxylase n=1 Tax=Rhizobium etli 8C-3 TaxID=538025 RepID=A0A1L5PAP1_RHIET|nr:carboxynorspermidine decarboxylase [Rhizobium etli]APO77219.1 carboxynorspermidine decarboxylase [Rhizobium etli 8C-3]
MFDTPCYLIDKSRLRRNLDTIATVREKSGVKALLALKCFATWSVFDLMRDYMDGTTSSSLNEVRLGRQRFGKETHAYSVAYADGEIDAVVAHADKVIFNSISQLERFSGRVLGLPCGLRLNPGISSSNFAIADPAQPFSRLGEMDIEKIEVNLENVSGLMIHNNCDNADFDLFDRMLGVIESRFGPLFRRVDWVSLGGGIHFTGDGYPIDAFSDRLKAFADVHGVQVYLEPGEAAVTQSATLETTVVDVVETDKKFAVIDASTEAHMLDLLIYRQHAEMAPDSGDHAYTVCGRSCLAGDVFGEFRFPQPLGIGDRISLRDAAGYTMVKKNWFNGLTMPAIAIRELDGQVRTVRAFTYEDYETSLS